MVRPRGLHTQQGHAGVPRACFSPHRYSLRLGGVRVLGSPSRGVCRAPRQVPGREHESTIQRAGGEYRAVADVLCDLGQVIAPLVSVCLPRKWGEIFPPGAGDWNETLGVGQGVIRAQDGNPICAGVWAQEPPRPQVYHEGFKEETAPPPDQELSSPPSWKNSQQVRTCPPALPPPVRRA